MHSAERLTRQELTVRRSFASSLRGTSGSPAHRLRSGRPEMVKQHWVYRMWDSRDRLLYIGVTSGDIRTRASGHKFEKPWWPLVHRVETTEFPDRKSAAEAERVALAEERSVFNILNTAERLRRNARLRLIAVPDEPWFSALRVAHDRDESVHTLVEEMLSEYVSRHRNLLEDASEE